MDETETDEDTALRPGDWCDDCRTHVASDGECECNQELSDDYDDTDETNPYYDEEN